MNLAELQQKLLAAARLHKPDDRVPYAFEKRIMARLAERAGQLRASRWGYGLMRAAASCALVALLFGVWTLLDPLGSNSGDDLSQDLQNTLLASADQAQADSLP